MNSPHVTDSVIFRLGMSTYCSAGNAKLLVLPVMFFVLKIDSSERYQKILYFWKFLEKILGRLNALAIPATRSLEELSMR